jgi:hypothetical protein
MRTSAIYNLTRNDINPEPNCLTSQEHSSVKGNVFFASQSGPKPSTVAHVKV